MLHDLDEPFNDLKGLSSFIEEEWLRRSIAQLTDVWHDNRSQAIFAIVLETESNRFNIFADALKEVRRYDVQLSKHVIEMEEFEVTSKLDRQKVLNGNSKALIDEEKYRKSSKRKFEQITERLVHAARTAQQHCEGGFHIDLLQLSAQGQDLLRGKIQDRIELMHLHTTTHGTRRWSGDKHCLGQEASNDENVLNGNRDNESTCSRPRSPQKTHSRSKSPIKKVPPQEGVSSPKQRSFRREKESSKETTNPFTSLLAKV